MKSLLQNFNKYIKSVSYVSNRGFILPFTMLICVLVLLVVSSSMTLLSKQLYFSKIYRQSQAAYYAADDAIACAIKIDDGFHGSDGLGIFPSSTTTSADQYINDVLGYINAQRAVLVPPQPPLALSDIQCAQNEIFSVTGTSSYATATNFYQHDNGTGIEYGVTSIYNMNMDLGVDPSDVLGVRHLSRCARVTINKTGSFRQIIAQGYAQCDNPRGSVERAVVNTTSY